MKHILIAAALFTSFAIAHAEGKGKMKMNAEAINAACETDAATAGCGEKKVGSGLEKCLHEYKKAHADFTMSETCAAATDKVHHHKK